MINNYFYDDFSVLFEAYQNDETFDSHDLDFFQIPLFRAYLQTIENLLETEYNKHEKIIETKIKGMTPEEVETARVSRIFPPEIEMDIEYLVFQSDMKDLCFCQTKTAPLYKRK